ncbi:GAF domain-containing protein [candidate division KSB1 bacterium]|nr:GAF domain-containing protein [candidate division KSB1 bacterium]NIR71688.1 GAF domain-containing protein [candidate division KSB1 bacterium]NIS26400.1 GAF domain-containing protein [candidate division KSB1 bacterium]NIT73159.1 GAF domain-containing protein [candidate division KSB1 bacterium]NIU27085.1 GAF domain-containing protein [candidate division KSB1 bacterium]
MSELTTVSSDVESTVLKRWFNALDVLYGHRQDIDALLQQATRMVVELLPIRYCMLTWITEDMKAMEVRAASYRIFQNGASEKIGTNTPRTSNIQEFWKTLQELSNGEITFCTNDHVKKLIAPIRVNGQIVGHMSIPKPETSKHEGSPVDTELFAIICAHIGTAVEIQQMHRMLSSQYASEQDTLGSHILSAARNPEYAAKIIARSFYKQLRRAGFETKQILVVASEIIDNLNKALCRTHVKGSCKN